MTWKCMFLYVYIQGSTQLLMAILNKHKKCRKRRLVILFSKAVSNHHVLSHRKMREMWEESAQEDCWMWKFYFYKGTREPPQAIIRLCGFQRPAVSTAVWLPNCEFRAWKRGMGPAQRVYIRLQLSPPALNRCSGSTMTQLVDELFMGKVLMQPRA